ncbi:TonB-dependent receptor family protein [Usitatibacter palustris]|uniref:Metal-pseudopaline receptor CntO n=1 Tax=Usitatibacter palustris TaxID=2732487 RepID=A0A6M4HAI4_9PROT|nr:TonB-dependent receptor [Usitatibacter palustris]QJR15057.1 Metal-pseudopaline receptor CntO [Usitatibacter palustris]
MVTATRIPRAAATVPASIDVLEADALHAGRLQVNLSESLQRLPGVVANDRQNYAQDLQISIRGFGARSTFGVRGLRILVDGIPATMPDGQSQISHVDLGSAERIEVLRGPFSALYGNSSGGVVSVTTSPGPPVLEGHADAMFGSDNLRRFGARIGDGRGPFAYNASFLRFDTDGYRDHSAATRTGVNARLRIESGAATVVNIIGNAVDMPGTQDPLGLSRAQFEADPRSVDPAAITFNTRKSVDQQQIGLALDHDFANGHAMRVTAHAGHRRTQQFQAIPVAPQLNPTHPGGVIDLDRAYGGVDARWNWKGNVGNGSLSIVAGVNADRLEEDRRGFQNFVGTELGVLGALRRDETNRASETGQYVQAEWNPTERWTVIAGVRASQVGFRSSDRYVTAQNPDDSGDVDYRATTPVGGINWQATKALSLYATAGRGFETPTLNEIAYRPDGQSGPNLALRPAKSDHFEAGAKWSEGRWRATAAAFLVDTTDEIVVATNSGGRSTFRNAGTTRREGLELLASGEIAQGLDLFASWTSLKAAYREGFMPGNRLPGVPRTSGYAEIRWRANANFEAAIEARHAGAMKVDDANSDEAPAYTVAAVRIGGTWRSGGLVARAFVRVDNLFDRRYAGSVIVNEANARYFEPAPGRSFLAGISVDTPF